MKNILITGAGGFLGNELIEQFSKTSYHIFALTSKKEALQKKYPNKCKAFSIREWREGKLPLDKIETVIHCAFARSNDFDSLKTSLDFSKEIFSYPKYNIINISSKSVYGQNPLTPWNENSNIQLDNMYAFAKYATELMIYLKNASSKTSNYTNIRLAGLIQKDLNDRVVNKFIDHAIKNNTINIRGGRQQFAYLDVRDAASAIIELLRIKSENWKPIYNLGNTRSYNIIEIAKIVKEITNESLQQEIKINIEKNDDIIYGELDSSSFYQDTKWKPKYNMEDMVKSIFEYKKLIE